MACPSSAYPFGDLAASLPLSTATGHSSSHPPLPPKQLPLQVTHWPLCQASQIIIMALEGPAPDSHGQWGLRSSQHGEGGTSQEAPAPSKAVNVFNLFCSIL